MAKSEPTVSTFITKSPSAMKPAAMGKARLPFVALYIQVDDIDEKAKTIEENGGFIVEAPFDTSSGSRICLFNEPSGVTFAMIQTTLIKKK